MLPPHQQQANGMQQQQPSSNGGTNPATAPSMLNRQPSVGDGGIQQPPPQQQRSMGAPPPNGNANPFGQQAATNMSHASNQPPPPGPPKQPSYPQQQQQQQDGYGMQQQQRMPSAPHPTPNVQPRPPPPQQQQPAPPQQQNGGANPFGAQQQQQGPPRPVPPPPQVSPRPSPPPSQAQMAPQQEEMRMNPMQQQAAAANRPPPPQQPPQQHQPPQQPRPQFHPSQPQPPQQQQQQGPPPPQVAPKPPQQQQQQQVIIGGPMHGMRELRVEDALIYLDDVKREFGDRPTIYNEFLEIMKNFKSQEVDTPGVIDRVSRLFRGYNKLILGFNKFLPDGYKISLQDIERREALEARERQLAAQQQQGGGGPQQQQQGGYFGARQGQQQGQAYQQQNRTGGPIGRPGGSLQQPQQRPQRHRPPQQQQPQQQPPPQQHQAVEFDHAISYVTNIKKRFANDPNTYHSFLEILHTYQKEQRGIKEVLEQVAALFADHPDLLKEFTFFLPDAVQEQAKERLHRAAAESEARMARGEAYGMSSPGYGGTRVETGRLALQQAQASSGGQKFIDMTGQRGSSPIGGRGMQARKRSLGPGGTGGQRASNNQGQPDSYVYNQAVERQFFDATREALTAYTRDGGQAWAEFLKCLDMYAQEILSRSDMLNLVEPLLGKRNSELFEEFKRILAAAGALSGVSPSTDDSWYSVPLSEIDFSRCRRCSPSYRALPRDYPDPPCSDRSPEEAKVLNDDWVSLPVGSEESYTFRHMRRNQYEEMLFRVEDERFEIDMVIDSNAATLRRLEPIAEEIMQLSQPELVTPDLASAGGGSKDDGGMGGVKYQYTFDRTILGVVHRNCITRIYGDAGQEMLDLIMKNPAVAVPVVAERLRQKDKEWRAVRDRLNRHWKELAEANYYKSLDHRSLTWRTVDKRATSTRTLISEIKDRAANGGKESQASLTARMDKFKEEHGSFFGVTMKERLTSDLDLTNLPKPERGIFTPHMSVMLENSSWVMRDAYRILTFALERGNNSPLDKERGNRLWRDFLGPWFALSLNWMQRPALSFKPAAISDAPALVSNGEDSGRDDDEDSNSVDMTDLGSNVVTEEMRDANPQIRDSTGLFDDHPIPTGSVVSTVFGEGRVKEFRREDNCYVVDLPFGTSFLRPNAVLCTVLTYDKSAYTNQLREQDSTTLERADDMMVIGTQSLYLFFRLFHILVRRLNIAKRLAYSVPTDQTLSTLVEQMSEDSGRRRYEAYLSLVYALIDGGLNHMGPGSGSIEGGKYEDRVRCLLGHGAYELATMDKLISHILKNVQAMGNDETMQNLVKLFRRHFDEGSFKPDAYRQEAAYLSDGEAMYGFQVSNVPGTDSKILHMDYMGVIADSEEESMDAEESEANSEPAPKRPRR